MKIDLFVRVDGHHLFLKKLTKDNNTSTLNVQLNHTKGEPMSESGWQYKVIDLSASATPLITGTAGKKIRVLSLFMDANNGSSTWRFETSTGPTELTGNLFLSSGASGASTATGAVVLPHNPTGWFETLAGDDLRLILSSGSAGLGGALVYELV